VRADGEIIADSLKVTVNGAFENMVGIYWRYFENVVIFLPWL
jgi:hypothetical protein